MAPTTVTPTQEVSFKTGNWSSYKALSSAGTLDAGTLYFCIDTLELFKGSTQLSSNNVVITTSVPDPSDSGVGIFSKSNLNGVHPSKIYIVPDGSGGYGAYVLDSTNKKMVNLSPSTMDADSVMLPEKVDGDETSGFVVNLGTGNNLAVGGLSNGTDISGKSIEEVLRMILTKEVNPTYTAPTVAIANNSGTASGSIEYGTSITPKIKATFTQHDAGSLTGIQFKKNDTNVTSTLNGNVATYTETAFDLTATTTYKAVASYNTGAIKKTNLGNDYGYNGGSTGYPAGSINTNNYTFTPFYQGYYVGTLSGQTLSDGETLVDKITASVIRGLTKKGSAYSATTKSMTIPVGAQVIIVACPQGNTGLTKVMNNSITQDVTATFVKMSSTIDVQAAKAEYTKAYNVWYYIPKEAYSATADLTFTFGA